ncbi:MAG TPA: hypothetical protein PLY87_08810 [Planctomycetaceae bacterium]|nr:hypothetical protein [Planctomycetaceae bacterium]
MKLMLLIALMLCGCCGCDTKDATSLQLDLDHLNWQTFALIGLAYMMNSQGHFATLAGMLKRTLQGLKVLPAADSQEALTAEQIAKLLADLYTQFAGHPDLQQGVLDLMQSHALPVPDDPESQDDSGVTAKPARKSRS